MFTQSDDFLLELVELGLNCIPLKLQLLKLKVVVRINFKPNPLLDPVRVLKEIMVLLLQHLHTEEYLVALSYREGRKPLLKTLLQLGIFRLQILQLLLLQGNLLFLRFVHQIECFHSHAEFSLRKGEQLFVEHINAVLQVRRRNHISYPR